MPDSPRRQRILEAILDGLKLITPGDTFQTDLGQRAYLYEAPAFGPEDDDAKSAIVIAVSDEEVVWQQVKLLIKLPIEVQALVDSDLDQPWLAAETIIGDIKRAMELDDRRLGGLLNAEMERRSVRALPREPGTTAVGLGVGYMLTFTEVWGVPEF